MSELISAAKHFAREAHLGQRRKYTGNDYIEHPEMVAYLVASVGGSEQMIAAAWLHDVVEDTKYTLFDLHIFGPIVMSYVDELTDKTKLEDGNRKFRKNQEKLRIAKISDNGKTIKLADLIDNSVSIISHDTTGFKSIYLQEKRELLEVLKCGNSTLWTAAKVLSLMEL